MPPGLAQLVASINQSTSSVHRLCIIAYGMPAQLRGPRKLTWTCHTVMASLLQLVLQHSTILPGPTRGTQTQTMAKVGLHNGGILFLRAKSAAFTLGLPSNCHTDASAKRSGAVLAAATHVLNHTSFRTSAAIVASGPISGGFAFISEDCWRLAQRLHCCDFADGRRTVGGSAPLHCSKQQLPSCIGSQGLCA